MTQLSIASLLLVCFVSLVASAQPQLGLPHVDGVTGFYRAGRMSGGTRTAPCPTSWSRAACGWGFETVYVIGPSLTKKAWEEAKSDAEEEENEAKAILREADALQKEADAQRNAAGNDNAKVAQAAVKDAQAQEKKIVGDRKKKEAENKLKNLKEEDPQTANHYLPGFELAGGYDFINFDRTRMDKKAGNVEVSGSVQTLPSITLYTSWDLPPFPDWPDTARSNRVLRVLPAFTYVGLGTGRIVLKSGAVTDNFGGQYSFKSDPDAWPAVISVGLGWHILGRSDSQAGLTGFVEYSYEVRNFQTGTYTFIPPPSDSNSNIKDRSAILPHSVNLNGAVLNVGFELKFPTPSTGPKQ